mgnify:CR=1 FL=1
MANRFSQNFTLTDIFNNKKLAGKLPLINYKEREREDGKISVRTSPKTINRLVFDTAGRAARGYYKPYQEHRSGDIMTIGGNLVGDYDEAYDAVYNALKSSEVLMKWTVNNGGIIRSALKEGEKFRRTNGVTPKLYLRAQSMAQIEGMSKRQLQALMTDIMENIVYGDDFPETKKKFNAESITTSSGMSYEQRQLRWKYKVGDF